MTWALLLAARKFVQSHECGEAIKKFPPPHLPIF